jgi:hypothetical protein
VGYLGAIRGHIEALLCDGAGSTRTLAVGRFARRVDALADPLNLAERQLDVGVGPGRPDGAPNPLDELAYMTHPLTIEVSYARTRGGDDLAEGLTAQDGPGADDELADRADADAQDIAAVLEWHENWPVAGAGANGVPEVWDVGQDTGADAPLRVEPERAVLTLTYRVRCRTRRTASALAP